MAVEQENVDIVKLLIEKSFDLNLLLKIKSIEEDEKEIIKTKTKDDNSEEEEEEESNERQIKINKETEEKTVLHAAIERKNVKIVELLLSNWAIDVNIPLKKESYSEIYEYSEGHLVQKTITNNKEEKTPLNIAVENENIEIVSLLLEQEININEYSIINNNDDIYDHHPFDEPKKTYYKSKIFFLFLIQMLYILPLRIKMLILLKFYCKIKK